MAIINASADDYNISIHALREEGDICCTHCKAKISHFYPRPPRGGRRHVGGFFVLNDQFLSTPSARRATSRSTPTGARSPNFYPRPPRGGRPKLTEPLDHPEKISIHALREEGDLKLNDVAVVVLISIHALREEGDTVPQEQCHQFYKFLSTPSARRATHRL